jgi:tight adherence protein C
LERNLKLAGIRMSSGDFSAIRLIVMISVTAASMLPIFAGNVLPEIRFLILVAGLIMAVLIPRYYLKSKITARQERIRQDLPDVLDLLSVSVDAGLGFDSAVLRVASQADSPLADELMTVHREIQMGKMRREALKDLSLRSNVEELKIFIGSVIQAEQLGISIKNILRTQSSQLRVSRKQRAEEKAMKAPVKMMLPLVIFVFPVIFIILLGPSVLEIAGMMKG